jgi:hypothetical protein
MTKGFAQQLQRDFIPGGGLLSPEEVGSLVFRRTTASELFQCCVSVGEDIQSGPLYCGRIAEWVAPHRDGSVALCGQRFGHTPAGIQRG